MALVQTHQEGAFAIPRSASLGYMFLARRGRVCGRDLSPDDPRLLKALLFLGAGSVIHAMAGEQDLQNMGRPCGSRLPITAKRYGGRDAGD